MIWSGNFAYAVGLLTSDGNLSKDGRHIVFVSKDKELVDHFMLALGLKKAIGIKRSGFNPNGQYFFVQFSDVKLYNQLLSIGLAPQKSKTVGRLSIPRKYFFDFLRGEFDGDGTFYAYWDKRWRSSFMYYLCFASASLDFINWIREALNHELGVKGHVSRRPYNQVFQLKYPKSEANRIILKMYPNERVLKLDRKYKKVYAALHVTGGCAEIGIQARLRCVCRKA